MCSKIQKRTHQKIERNVVLGNEREEKMFQQWLINDDIEGHLKKLCHLVTLDLLGIVAS
jgi:hypothetical protein